MGIKKRFVIRGIILSLLIILILITSFFDYQISKSIEGLRIVGLDYFFISIAFASNVFIIFFFLTTLFLWKEHKRRWIFPLWLASFLSIVISFFLKIIIKRPRPFQVGISTLAILFHFMKDNFNTWNFSFPSFQSVLVFSALPILSKEFRKFKYIWLIFACLVAFSRVYFGVHYLSDVLAGALIGYLIGLIMVNIEKRYKLGLRLIKGLNLQQ